MSPEETQALPTEPPKQRRVEPRNAPDGLIRVYANNVALAATRFDIKIIFGEVAEIDAEKAAIQNNVQVTLSWFEAKLLGEFLQANVKAYEDLNGPLKLPKVQEKIVVPNTFPDAEMPIPQ